MVLSEITVGILIGLNIGIIILIAWICVGDNFKPSYPSQVKSTHNRIEQKETKIVQKTQKVNNEKTLDNIEYVESETERSTQMVLLTGTQSSESTDEGIEASLASGTMDSKDIEAQRSMAISYSKETIESRECSLGRRTVPCSIQAQSKTKYDNSLGKTRSSHDSSASPYEPSVDGKEANHSGRKESHLKREEQEVRKTIRRDFRKDKDDISSDWGLWVALHAENKKKRISGILVSSDGDEKF